MAKRHANALHIQRTKVLEYARALTRSGKHSDHKSIITLLMAQDDATIVRRWLEDWAFCAQIDKLCAMARGAVPELTSRRVQRRMLKVICEESRA